MLLIGTDNRLIFVDCGLEHSAFPFFGGGLHLVNVMVTYKGRGTEAEASRQKYFWRTK